MARLAWLLLMRQDAGTIRRNYDKNRAKTLNVLNVLSQFKVLATGRCSDVDRSPEKGYLPGKIELTGISR